MTRTVLATSAALMCLCARSVADPLLFAPTGATLTTGQVHAAAALSPSDSQDRYYWLGAGLAQVELNYLRVEKPVGGTENLLGAQWNFLPETIITPAVGFGVRDALSDSDEGIGVYAAITRHMPVGASSRFLRDLAVTAGVGVGGVKGLFFGFEARLPSNFVAQGEYDSRDINGAIAWQPISLLRLKAYLLRSEFYLGAELVPMRF